MCHARKERVLLFGTDQRITSGPAARTAAFRGRIHGCTRTIRGNVRFFSCPAWAVHTFSDMAGALANVCNRGKTGNGADLPSCRSLTRLGHQLGRNPALQEPLTELRQSAMLSLSLGTPNAIR